MGGRPGRRYTEIFNQDEGNPTTVFRTAKKARRAPSSDSSDSSDSDSSHQGGGPLPAPFGTPARLPQRLMASPSVVKTSKPANELTRFDLKLKIDVVPLWDGNPDTLARWMLKVNQIAKRSSILYTQLGEVIPQRLSGAAENWYYSLRADVRSEMEENWGTMKKAIRKHWMNRRWLERQKSRANRARYRDSSAPTETPSEYYIRKLELLEFVYDYTQHELIYEILNCAPVLWNSLLSPDRFNTLLELQDAIKYYDDTLISLHDARDFTKPANAYRPSTSGGYSNFRPRSARTNLITAPRNGNGNRPTGGRTTQTSWPFPKDDSVVSRLKNKPEDVNARPCRHCGSGKHWDNECSHSRKGQRLARANLANVTEDEEADQEAYDELYYAQQSEDEDEIQEADENAPEQDFREPLQGVAAQVNRVEVAGPSCNEAAALEGVTREEFPKTILRRGRRRAAKEFKAYARLSEASKRARDQVLTLPKLLARPPGTSFLGAKATKAPARLGDFDAPFTNIIADTGSDITLISSACLQSLRDPPRVRAGQRINLIQVTGSARIDGFVDIALFFEPKGGPVRLDVEAYVVKGMSTPFILGNDFQDQYGISIIRKEGAAEIHFGDSGRVLPVESSTSPSLVDDGGHAFNIVRKGIAPAPSARTRRTSRDHFVRVKETTVIPPESSKLVAVNATFSAGADDLFVERVFSACKNPDDVFGAANTLISRAFPKIHVANFARTPVTVAKGEVVGIAHNPRTWLATSAKLSGTELARFHAHARLIRGLVETATSETEGLITSRGKDPHEDPASTTGSEGGPKTAELPPEDIPEEDLLKEVGFSEHLTEEQRARLQEAVSKHKMAFSLNGRLGHYDAKVEIPMKEEVKPISLPPYPSSPANREVMDKQMDTWLELGVIEPSVSPWAAPVFIAWRNGKPRMVIDLRKFNEAIVPDEFPIPRQEDILQALEGSQWLSTLDALSGFTQLEITERDKEKLAFRTHRGLFQFKRMPFGYRNGPSVFQRIMQNILAPYLWVFTLVYIDDIVIYSLTFDEHVKHLDQVFAAIEKAGLTLSPGKCHLGYQSLMLLGQKVSRLGISTHKDKVDAIIALEEPRNVKELQTFLGMMVYFSAYIPFYAWIAAPLFELLKKDGKGWRWEPRQQEAFELCKQVLMNAPVRAYAMPNRPFRLYSDACDYGLAAILQQVQPITIRDLQGTRTYDRLRRAFDKGEPVPQLVTAVPTDINDVPPPGKWATNFEDTTVHIERVIAYWSRILKAAERNYSPTEREALALKEGLIKFQAYLEGTQVLAITDHAALTWSRTFQNVNKRLMTWGTVFSAYPGMRIVHRAGRVHSNVDPISRLRRRVPLQNGPVKDPTKPLLLAAEIEDPLEDMFASLGDHFEARLLKVASKHAEALLDEESPASTALCIPNADIADSLEDSRFGDCHISAAHSLLIGFSPEHLAVWTMAYQEDSHFRAVLKALKGTIDWGNLEFPQYTLREDGLIVFHDGLGNERVCVPGPLRVSIMKEVHDSVTEGAHAGYHRCYNRIASVYYWPRMSRDIKQYAETCDICQKAKPRRHAPVGLLRSIPVPTRPFEVVSMDFIPELPQSAGFDNILVIVDKLTKYGIFIPCHTTLTETDTAKLFFKHVICEYGIPRQIISDRDVRWRGEFWKETCRLLGTTRALTTSYHPQADGQTEVMNQGLEIALRAYVGPSRDDWAEFLPALSLAYNTTPHSATGYAPGYLLRGYTPVTTSSFMHDPSDVHASDNLDSLVPSTTELLERFQAERSAARDALVLGQAHQQRAYNKGRLIDEFEEGDLVVLNVDSLELLRSESGRGRKLLMKYDGPFEIIRKLSPVSYQVRLPASYGMHPILNIAHLERYKTSPTEFGDRPTKRLQRENFAEQPEFEVESILRESTRKGRNGRRIPIFLTRFKGYSSEHDQWLTRAQLRNAPEIMGAWVARKREGRLGGN